MLMILLFWLAVALALALVIGKMIKFGRESLPEDGPYRTIKRAREHQRNASVAGREISLEQAAADVDRARELALLEDVVITHAAVLDSLPEHVRAALSPAPPKPAGHRGPPPQIERVAVVRFGQEKPVRYLEIPDPLTTPSGVLNVGHGDCPCERCWTARRKMPRVVVYGD